LSKVIIVPVSGGKDSQVVLSLAKERSAGRLIVCVHQNTGFDHPATYKQIEAMEKFYGVEISHTKSKWDDGMFGFLKDGGYFPNSVARGCTKELKQRPFLAWLLEFGFDFSNCEIWFGMRAKESKERADAYGHVTEGDEFTLMDVADFYGSNAQLRATIGNISVRLPIVDWPEERVFAHIKTEGAPLNPLYARGHSRVGCYPCLLTRKSEWALAAADPTGRANIEGLIRQEVEWKANGNKRKLIRVHKVWDVRDFLRGADVPELPASECGYCSI
jgi:3'-phosphoadenosine 5'-phosphosulfate sulfotransferase (PAPS reductase)/FAD synthetase